MKQLEQCLNLFWSQQTPMIVAPDILSKIEGQPFSADSPFGCQTPLEITPEALQAVDVAPLPIAERLAVVHKPVDVAPRCDARVAGKGVRADDGATLVQEHGLTREFVFEHALKGASFIISPGKEGGVRNDSRVAFLERNQRVHLFVQTVPTGVQRIFADDNPNVTIDGVDDYRIDVDVAVIDTGIDFDHPDLNVVARTNCARKGPMNTECKDNDGDDGNGHGTHVSGSIAAIDNGDGVVGVAPGARLWAVKVLGNDGSGWMSWIIAGIDYVTDNADQIEVANMSLGCKCSSSAMDTAIANSVAAGVAYAVAAGNDDEDASSFSPANHPDVITVSALADFDGEPGALGSATCRTDEDDTLANFSNYGSYIEVTAPGVCILSTWKDGGYNTISGTSMASPHTAGAAALLAASGITDPATIRQTIINEGNYNWTDDSGDSIQEPLLDVSNTTVFNPAMVAGSGGGPPPPPPTLTSISVTPISASIVEGQTQQSTATGHFSDESTADLTSTAVWESSDAAVATIDASGLATGVSVGTTNITASKDGVTSNTASLEVTTPPPPPTLLSISVTPSTASIAEGQTQQFTATGAYTMTALPQTSLRAPPGPAQTPP